MNKEVYQEGWLIKSPPTKRIWRARWRRRYFTLKQGEIPGQFCLEYYTDRNCRKSKGAIDLDQCEQVDSGLRLEHRKQKFQNMFAIKTPQRIYYLAADTENDMRDWVNCICQVCNLHDSTKQAGERQYYNLTCENDAPLDILPQTAKAMLNNNTSNETTSTSLNSSSRKHSNNADVIRRTHQLSLNNSTYSNHDEFAYVNTEYSNRETMIFDGKLTQNSSIGSLVSKLDYLNVIISPNLNASSQPSTSRTVISSSGIVKKIPENLVLSNTFIESSVEPSPALSTSSGPYIPISECFSGSPKFLIDENPTTPLNNLDPKFYDTPRSYNNIGLNLTNDQSYSPKITNCSQMQSKTRSGRSSPTDSESVFTDDDDCSVLCTTRESADRNPRPSDSSVENETIVFTYAQRFSKLPEVIDAKIPNESDLQEKSDKSSKKRHRLFLESTAEDEKILRDIPQFSDTDNTSPAIGPRDASSCVDESYDIPRSHNLPYYKLGQLMNKPRTAPDNPIAASTPNLLCESECGSAVTGCNSSRTLPRQHFYTNAAPTRIEGNVFRYDFIEQGDLPPVNRKLKPKISAEDKPCPESPIIKPITPDSKVPKQVVISNMDNIPQNNAPKPPSIDRKLKPMPIKELPSGSNTLRRYKVQLNQDQDSKASLTLPRDSSSQVIASNLVTAPSSSSSVPPLQSEHKLQYFDLDVANPPPINRNSMIYNNTITANNLKTGSTNEQTVRPLVKSSVVYNSVDFIKTEAFKRVREERKKESEGLNNK